MRWSFAHLVPTIVATPTPYFLAEAGWHRELIALAMFALVAAAWAAAQALAIRRAVPGAMRWMVATFGGVLLAVVVAAIALALLDAASRLPEMLTMPLALGAAGAVLGAAQWLVLRRHAAGAGGWIAVSAIACAVLTIVALPFFDVMYIPGHVRGLFPRATEMTTALRVIMAYGLATGWALRAILRTRA